MAQYVYTLRRVGKTVPPKRQILKNISLNFFPGAKIGVLGLNGSGKSTLLRIMAGEDTNFEGEVIPMPNMKIGFLPQEPQLDPEKTVRDAVEEGLGETLGAKKRLDEIYAAYAEPEADFDKLAAEQAKLEAIVNAAHADSTDLQMEVAADALRLPPWDAKVDVLSGGEKRRVALCRRGTRGSARTLAPKSAASRCAGCCFRNPTSCCSTSPPTISMRRACNGWSSSSSVFPAPWWR
jgi:sulfate-transporting ATPase